MRQVYEDMDVVHYYNHFHTKHCDVWIKEYLMEDTLYRFMECFTNPINQSLIIKNYYSFSKKVKKLIFKLLCNLLTSYEILSRYLPHFICQLNKDEKDYLITLLTRLPSSRYNSLLINLLESSIRKEKINSLLFDWLCWQFTLA